MTVTRPAWLHLTDRMVHEPLASALRQSRRDPSAFDRFYRSQVEGLLAFVASRVIDIETAWDLTAESFARAFLKRRSFRGRTDGEASSWLYSIANREILQFHRRARIEKRALIKLGIDPPSLSEEEQTRILELAGLEEIRAAIRLELQRLGKTYRDAISLRVLDELPYEEVAGRLGVSEQTARARVSRGLRALREAIDLREQALEGGKQ